MPSTNTASPTSKPSTTSNTGGTAVSVNTSQSNISNNYSPSNLNSTSSQSVNSASNNITPFSRAGSGDNLSKSSPQPLSQSASNNIVPISRDNNRTALKSLSGSDVQDLVREKVKPLDISKMPVTNSLAKDNPAYQDYIKKLEDAYKNSPSLDSGDGGGAPPRPPIYRGYGGTDGNNNNDGFKKFYSMASLISSAWALLINLLIFIIALSLILALVVGGGLFFVDLMCSAADAAPGWVKPDNIEQFCNYYKQLKGGCLDVPQSTDSTKPGTDTTGLANLSCIGEGLQKDNNPTVFLYGLSGQTQAKKDVIREIIAAGTKAGVSADIIKLTIAMYPIITPNNAWKETANSGCYGILQLCDNNSTSLNNQMFRESIIGLDFKDVSSYQSNPELQMKSIKNVIEKRETDFRSASKCIETAVLNKSNQWRKAYLFNKFECDGDSIFLGTTKTEFANRVEKNFNAMDCKQFRDYYNSVKNTASNYQYQQSAYVENPKIQLNYKELVNNWKNGLAVISEAQFANIRKEECEQAKKYKSKLEEASKKYSNRLLPLSPSLLAGLFGRESNFATRYGGCAGWGDAGNGHGIAQADPSAGNDLPGPNTAPGFKISVRINKGADSQEPKINKDYPQQEKYVWSDCNEGIMYGAGHLVEMQHYAHNIIIGKLKAANMDISVDDNGFKDQATKKAYIQAVLISNNRGQGGLNTDACAFDSAIKLFREGCTAAGPSGKGDYATDIFKRGLDFAKCMGFDATESALFSADSKSSGSGVNTNCAEGSSSTSNAGDGDFPLITKAGSNVVIRFTAGWPQYPGGGAHNGTDWGPEPNLASTSKVMSISDGEVVSDFATSSRSCTGGCSQSETEVKMQRAVRIKAPDGRTYGYVHLDLSPALALKKKGDKVKKGDIIGQLDQSNVFTHLHFSVFVNNVDVQPLDHLKGLPTGFAPNPALGIKENNVPKALHEKLP